jgi:hypothetical protein
MEGAVWGLAESRRGFDAHPFERPRTLDRCGDLSEQAGGRLIPAEDSDILKFLSIEFQHGSQGVLNLRQHPNLGAEQANFDPFDDHQRKDGDSKKTAFLRPLTDFFNFDFRGRMVGGFADWERQTSDPLSVDRRAKSKHEKPEESVVEGVK